MTKLFFFFAVSFYFTQVPTRCFSKLFPAIIKLEAVSSKVQISICAFDPSIIDQSPRFLDTGVFGWDHFCSGSDLQDNTHECRTLRTRREK